ncbi:aminotransferase-like domain-containing protein [Glutamicibacter uratoxydans]|nr:PLP-dependent aminotransferase family protein [Glutamicibacter uratoxydans]
MNNDSSSQIVEKLKKIIDSSAPGTRLPSTRSLVTEFQASPVTVQKALQSLSMQGLIESRPGIGTFTRSSGLTRPADYSWQSTALGSARTRRTAAATPLGRPGNDSLSLHHGYPEPGLLPSRLVRSAVNRASRSESALACPPPGGLPDLQRWFARELAEQSIGSVTPTAKDVIIMPGSQSGLSSIFASLVGAGQPLLVESPTYWGALLAAENAGVQLIPVSSGPNGPDPVELSKAFDRSGARMFYAQPNFANPTGAQWTAALKEQILAVVRRHSAFLVEDDWAHDFGIESSSIPLAAADDSGHVIYIRSLTKSVSPSLRVAAVITRGPARDRILANTAAEAMYVSGLLQAAALDVVTQPAWNTHLRSLRSQLSARRDLLISSLHAEAPEAQLELVPQGGLNLWLRLPEHTDLKLLTQDCLRAGLAIAGEVNWFPAEPAGKYLRVNYAGERSAEFPEAARILGEALRSQ